MKTIKQLDKEFTGVGEVRGFLFTQVANNEDGYIYKVSIENSHHYEVFKRKISKTFKMGADLSREITGEKVSYPTSKAFGVWAWSCLTLEKAIVKLNDLNK